jgi:hypothetical protein
MSNTLTAFTPQLWSRESVRILREKIQMPQVVNKDFSTDLASYGDTVNTRKITKFGDADDVPTDGTDLAVTDLNASNITVTLNKHKHKTFKLTSREATRSFMNLVVEYLDPAMLSLANTLDKDLLALYASIVPTVTCASAGGYKDAFNKCKLKLNKQLCPQQGRVAVIADEDEAGLTNLDLIVQANTSGSTVGLIEGSIGRFKGFDILRSTNVFSVGSPAVRYNLLFNPNAFTLVTRVCENADPANTGAKVSVSTDPDAGLAIRSTISFQHLKAFGTYVSVDILYGVAVLDASLAVVLRGTTNPGV